MRTPPSRRVTGRLLARVLASLFLAGLFLASTSIPVATADSDGKGSDIGGPAESRSTQKRRFGVDPSELSLGEKSTRLATIRKEYESLKRNQDVLQVRARRTYVNFVGDMRFEPAGDFLKQVFVGDRDERTRIAALIALGKSGHFANIQDAVKKCLSTAKKNDVFALAIPRMFQSCREPQAGAWLLTRLKGVKNEFVLAALVEAIGYTAEPTAAPVLLTLAQKNKYVPVRFEALRALGSCGGTSSVTDILPFLGHEDWRLRMAAAEGLGRTNEPTMIPQLRQLLVSSEPPIVVETAIEAIGAIGGKPAVEPLIEGLRVGRLRARNKARQALIQIARSDFRQKKDYFTDPEAWNSWWKKVRNPGTGVGQTPVAAEGESETISYFGVKIHSDAVLFILDISGSMEWPDAPKELGIRPADWKQRRIDLAHIEMFRTLRLLRPETRFNIATFAGVVTPWQKEAVPATPDNVETAISWTAKQLPRGGTATYDALEYGIEKSGVDTIYILTDGIPSLGKHVEPETLLAQLRIANRFRRVTINAVSLIVGRSPIEKHLKNEDPDEMAEFLQRIAEENFGRFVDRSHP